METMHTKLILGGVVAAGLVLFGASYYVEEQHKEIVSKMLIEVIEQEKTLSNIAEITDRNGADAVVEKIIRDCNVDNRQKFDDYLNRLHLLNNAELLEAQKLFDACANFYASRKAVMVARMDREFEVYRDMVELLSIVDDEIAISQFQVGEWERLVDLEKRRSDVFDRQVDLQQSILTALMQGQNSASADVQARLLEAQNVNEEALVVNQQIDALRSELLGL